MCKQRPHKGREQVMSMFGGRVSQSGDSQATGMHSLGVETSKEAAAEGGWK